MTDTIPEGAPEGLAILNEAGLAALKEAQEEIAQEMEQRFNVPDELTEPWSGVLEITGDEYEEKLLFDLGDDLLGITAIELHDQIVWSANSIEVLSAILTYLEKEDLERCRDNDFLVIMPIGRYTTQQVLRSLSTHQVSEAAIQEVTSILQRTLRVGDSMNEKENSESEITDSIVQKIAVYRLSDNLQVFVRIEGDPTWPEVITKTA